MKDRDMAMARQRQGTYAGNVEENGSAAGHENEGDQLVSGLESARRSMGPWELSGVSARSRRVSRPRVQSLGARIDRNSFAALSSDEEEASVPPAPTYTACLAEYPWRVKVAQQLIKALPNQSAASKGPRKPLSPSCSKMTRKPTQQPKRASFSTTGISKMANCVTN